MKWTLHVWANGQAILVTTEGVPTRYLSQLQDGLSSGDGRLFVMVGVELEIVEHPGPLHIGNVKVDG